MTKTSDLSAAFAKAVETATDTITALPPAKTRRLLVAIAGPPGSGKSTLAEALVAELIARGRAVVLMPMDGFHLDDRLLDPRGLLPRKGAPETYDFRGFAATVERVRHEETVVLPVFDRSREIAIAGAEEIAADTEIVVVEGNYLCLDEAPWRDLMSCWDYSVFLNVSLPELERRLVQRWLDQGLSPETAETKAKSNDILNAKRVISAIGPVDVTIGFD